MNINVDSREMSEELSKLITKKIQSGEIGISQITLVELEAWEKPIRLEGIQIEDRRKEK